MTQSLIAVWYQNRFQVLQHAQWDGCPGGQGLRIYEILKRPGAIRAIKAGLEASLPINGKNLSLYSSDWCPSLDHGMGANILEMIQVATPMRLLPLYLDYEFANDTKHCQHAYIIDLDKEGSFEVYAGQVSKSEAPRSHFQQLGDAKDTIPHFLVSFPLDDLPETGEDFIEQVSLALKE